MENEAKQMAWFPAPYLEKLDDDDDEDEDDIDGTPERGKCTDTVPAVPSQHLIALVG